MYTNQIALIKPRYLYATTIEVEPINVDTYQVRVVNLRCFHNTTLMVEAMVRKDLPCPIISLFYQTTLKMIQLTVHTYEVCLANPVFIRDNSYCWGVFHVN